MTSKVKAVLTSVVFWAGFVVTVLTYAVAELDDVLPEQWMRIVIGAVAIVSVLVEAIRRVMTVESAQQAVASGEMPRRGLT